MQFIDLSIPITNDVISDPPVMRPNITYMTHENTWEQIAMFFPGLTKDDLPDGEGRQQGDGAGAGCAATGAAAAAIIARGARRNMVILPF